MSALRKWLVITVVLPATIVTWGTVLVGFALVSLSWTRDFSASHGEIMLALTLCQLGQGLMAPGAGYMVGKLSIRNLLLIGLGLTALGLVLVAEASAMWQVLALYALVLAAGTLLTGPLITQALAVRLFSENKGLATGVVTSALSFCAFVMPPVINMMLAAYNWRNTFWIVAAILIFALVPLTFFFVRETPATIVSGESEPAPEPTVTFKDIARSRLFWGLTFAFMPLLFMFNGVFYNLGFNLIDQGGTSAQATTVLAAAGISSLPGILLYGYLADRFRHLPLFILNVVMMAGMATLASVTGTYAAQVLAVPAWTFFQGGTLALVPIILATHFGPTNFPRANGLIAVFQSAAIFGAAVAGFGRDMLGSYQAAFTTMLVVVPFSLLALLLLKPRRTGPAQALAAG
ncbi:MAG: MFS transporter [Alphaproteobacteria bacterium]|nr:MFS transporter [Alphaproteobacteria bacterium]